MSDEILAELLERIGALEAFRDQVIVSFPELFDTESDSDVDESEFGDEGNLSDEELDESDE